LRFVNAPVPEFSLTAKRRQSTEIKPMSVYHIPPEGMKQGHLVREIRCSVCDSADLFLPAHGTRLEADIIQCAGCGAPIGAYKTLADFLEGAQAISGKFKAITRVEWQHFEYE
jgi:hypothetical protein